MIAIVVLFLKKEAIRVQKAMAQSQFGILSFILVFQLTLTTLTSKFSASFLCTVPSHAGIFGELIPGKMESWRQGSLRKSLLCPPPVPTGRLCLHLLLHIPNVNCLRLRKSFLSLCDTSSEVNDGYSN